MDTTTPLENETSGLNDWPAPTGAPIKLCNGDADRVLFFCEKVRYCHGQREEAGWLYFVWYLDDTVQPSRTTYVQREWTDKN